MYYILQIPLYLIKKQSYLRLHDLLVGLVDDHLDVPRQRLGFPVIGLLKQEDTRVCAMKAVKVR